MRNQRPAFINEVAGLRIVAAGELCKETDMSPMATDQWALRDRVTVTAIDNRRKEIVDSEDNLSRENHRPQHGPNSLKVKAHTRYITCH